MISLEQVRALEDRVERAVAYIANLRGEVGELGRRLVEAQASVDEAAKELAESENMTQKAENRADAAELQRQTDLARFKELESRLSDMAERVAAAETRAAELSARAEEYRKDQVKIEEGIVHALEKLDSFEDLVLEQAGPATSGSNSRARAIPAASKEETSEEPKPDSGIAVKAEPEAGSGSSQDRIESAENELDIF